MIWCLSQFWNSKELRIVKGLEEDLGWGGESLKDGFEFKDLMDEDDVGRDDVTNYLVKRILFFLITVPK